MLPVCLGQIERTFCTRPICKCVYITMATSKQMFQVLFLVTNIYSVAMATDPSTTQEQLDSPLTGASCPPCACNIIPVPAGPPGAAGTAGVPGVPGIGIQGPQGLSGPAGNPGIPGVPGQGSKGSKGDIGQGQPGEIGQDGERGPIGLTGLAGPIGPPGKLGPSGIKGQQGVLGATGHKGVKGEKGDILNVSSSAFTVYRTSGLTVTSASTASQVITYEQEEFDIGDDMDHTTGIYTCPVAGVYYFSFSMWSSGGNTVNIELQVNGLNKGRVQNGKGERHMPQGAGITLSLSAGDEVQLKAKNPTGIAGSSNNDSFFSGFLLHSL